MTHETRARRGATSAAREARIRMVADGVVASYIHDLATRGAPAGGAHGSTSVRRRELSTARPAGPVEATARMARRRSRPARRPAAPASLTRTVAELPGAIS